MEKTALFRFKSYKVNRAVLNFINMPDQEQDEDICLHFNVSGVYMPHDSLYRINIGFIAGVEEYPPMAEVNFVADFQFKDQLDIDDIPEYFYANSIAIVFPYIRAFISTLSLQANHSPMILPTMNLIGLNEELKRNTKLG